MRADVWIAGALLFGAWGCSKQQPPAQITDAGPYGTPPDRTVAGDLTLPEIPEPPPDLPPPDLGVEPAYPRDVVEAAPPDLPSDPVLSCDLLTQQCKPSYACYPTGAPGQASCQLAGFTPPRSPLPCTANTDCERLSLCVPSMPPDARTFCAPVCDLSKGDAGCQMGETCYPLTGFTGVGYCKTR